VLFHEGYIPCTYHAMEVIIALELFVETKPFGRGNVLSKNVQDFCSF
jgi:hypothetical protein